MKKRIITWSTLVVAIVIVVLILVGNKSTLEGKIIKDEISAYPVIVETVKSIKPNVKVEYTGTTKAVNDIELISETQGRVISVNCETGSKVAANKTIVKVDDELVKANYILATSAYEKAKKDLERFETLYKENNISLDNLEGARLQLQSSEAELLIAKKQFDNTSITSPINGIIETRYVNVGSTVAPGMPIANIVDVSQLKVTFEAADKDITKIKPGSPVEVTTSLFTGKIFYGTISSVGVKANDAHNYPVEAAIDNKEGSLKAGMYVKAEINLNSDEEIMVIPRTALVGSIKNPKVYVVENNKAVLKTILIGDIYNGYLHVKEGVTPGDKVVTQGQNNIEAGDNVIIKSN